MIMGTFKRVCPSTTHLRNESVLIMKPKMHKHMPKSMKSPRNPKVPQNFLATSLHLIPVTVPPVAITVLQRGRPKAVLSNLSTLKVTK